MPLTRLLLLAFFGYVLLDLCCPLVPGAVSFDPDESVEAVNAYRVRPTPSVRVANPPGIVIERVVSSPVPLAARVSRVPAVSFMERRLHGRHRRPPMTRRSASIDDN